MKKSFFLLFALPVAFISCTTNAVTGRKQLNLLPESQLQETAATEYKGFLAQSKEEATRLEEGYQRLEQILGAWETQN